jgi:hypothetical protein
LKATDTSSSGNAGPIQGYGHFYASEGHFRTALAIEKDGTSALISTPDTALN